MANVLSADVLNGLDVKSYPSGARIFSKGERADVAYLLVSGDVALIGINAEGKNTAHGRIAPGQIFGETAYIDEAPRPFHAVAVKESQCAVIDRVSMGKRMTKVDPFIRYWIEFMSQRLTELGSRAEKGNDAAKGDAAS
ncbi:MAG: cyclic nucleotide-binding domain-containing protein [Rhodospirillaceae bacterium]|nr:cyclic nucleotide-binding domain-containing protein [Rhodospirillaceae bacterium]